MPRVNTVARSCLKSDARTAGIILLRHGLLVSTEVAGVVVSRLGRHQSFDRLDGVDATPGAVRHAVHCRGSTGEVELALQVPALQQAIDKAGVEDVARAGRIDDRDPISGPVVKLFSIPRQNSAR